jgi:hypothetical protein
MQLCGAEAFVMQLCGAEALSYWLLKGRALQLLHDPETAVFWAVILLCGAAALGTAVLAQ